MAGVAKPDIDYFKDRLENQISWHSAKSRENKKKYNAMQTAIILTSASITVINAFRVGDAFLSYVATLSSILGGTTVVLAALVQLHKYQENWIIYRTTSEMLKKEKYFYLNGAGSYEDLNPEQQKKMLVERVEMLVSSETSKYFALQKSEKTGLPEQSVQTKVTS